MKILFASDIHGSVHNMFTLTEKIEEENPDEVIFTGDFCGFTVLELMRDAVGRIAPPITYITGNCDTDFQLQAMNLSPFGSMLKREVNGKRIFVTHGHIYNRSNPPEDIDIMFYGHLHKPFIKEENGKIFVNVGSAAQPRSSAGKTYVVFDEKGIYIKELDFGDVIEERKFD